MRSDVARSTRHHHSLHQRARESLADRVLNPLEFAGVEPDTAARRAAIEHQVQDDFLVHLDAVHGAAAHALADARHRSARRA